MTATTISHIVSMKQAQTDAREGVSMNYAREVPKYILVESIIREYGKLDSDGFTVNLNDLADYDQQLLLSYVADSEEYADACSNSRKLRAWVSEYSRDIEKLISKHSDAAYRDYMEEMHEWRGSCE